MSQWRGQIRDISEPEDVVEFVGQYYHVPTLLALLGFMLWSRVRDWQNFIVDGTVFFSGNDAWYHYRSTVYTVQNWPQTMPFDPWTHFPYGTSSSQFGTFFDQVIATVALIVGLGNPSDHTIRLVVLFAPAVIGTAVAIPVYLMGKRTAGRFAGVIAVAILAFVGSEFVSRSTVGFSDHHVAETLLQTIAMLATMVAVSVAEEEKVIWELFEARDVAAIRRPVGWAVLAGVAIAAYIWTWPPGVFIVGILGVYFLLELSSAYVHGESPEHVAIAGTIAMAVAGVLSLAAMESTGISATGQTFLQPGLAFAVALGCAFMAWLAREWGSRELPRYQYPLAIGGIVVVGTALVALLLPDLFDFMTTQITRVIGFTRTPTAGTVGEAQPLPPGELYQRYQFAILVAALGAAYIAVKHIFSRVRPELLLLVVWGVFVLAAALTQVRFDYYLVVPVAVLTGYTVGLVADVTNVTDPSADIETYQVLTVVAVFFVLFLPLLYPSALAMDQSSAGPGEAPQAWDESLEWMDENTPPVGTLGDADDEMDLYGTHARTDDFDYEAGAYGVLSWWDYGHWITVMGERIPDANPFQQGANEAANYLLSTSEDQANTVAERLDDGNGTETRYVMVDWKMATAESQYVTSSGTLNIQGKYFAPFAFYDDGQIDQSEYISPLYYETGAQQGIQHRRFWLRSQGYYDSTAVRLYHHHGSSIEPSSVVLDWDLESTESGTIPVSQGLQEFDNMSAARDYVREDGSAQVGGVGPYPEERVPAMENHRLIRTSDRSALDRSDRYQLGLSKVARGAFPQGLNQGVADTLHHTEPSWVKLFERVDGATIEGDGPANETVYASVEMQPQGSGENFTYSQRARTDENGEFTMTVPYSTTGYEDVGDDYSNVSVRATGPYTIQAGSVSGNDTTVHRATANVTEQQVIGEDDSPVEVEMQSVSLGSGGE